MVRIIMATYNGEKYVREQIESILANTYTAWKMTICDDCSTDGTVSILKEYEEKYKDKIEVKCNNKNIGVVKNFLTAIKECDDDYIMLCDQDDVWRDTKIENAVRRMLSEELNGEERIFNQKRKPAAECIPVVYFSDATVVDEELNTINSSFHKSSNLDITKLDLSHMLMENKVIGCTMMFNKAVKNKITKLPNDIKMHDWWIALIGAAFGKIVYSKRKTVLYRQHNENVIGVEEFSKYAKEAAATLESKKVNIIENEKQALAFLELYKNELSEENKEILETFAYLEQNNWITKRTKMIKYGFLKSGFARNLGLMKIM